MQIASSVSPIFYIGKVKVYFVRWHITTDRSAIDSVGLFDSARTRQETFEKRTAVNESNSLATFA